MSARSSRFYRAGCTAGGFTLVELLIALALTALVSLVLVQQVNLAGQGAARLTERATRADERRGLEMLLRRSLADAVLIPAIDGIPAFAGGPSSLTFLTVVDDAGPGLYSVRLALDQTGPEPVVTVSRRLADRSVLPRATDSVLLRGVRTFGISYFGATSPAVAAGWHRHWENVAELPALVRIVYRTADGSAPPPIVLRLRNGG